MKPAILFWSQNADLYVLFSHILAVEGFKSVLVDDEDVQARASEAPVLAILLDTENRIERALRLCDLMKKDKKTAHIPLVALAVDGKEQAYLDLLKVGVDESFIRPTTPARILGYLRSLVPGPSGAIGGLADNGNRFKVWELNLEISRRLVRHERKEIQLAPIEFRLLCRLLQAPGRVFSRSELIEAAWPPNCYVQPRTVDVHVGRLRRALRQMTGRDIIRTIRSTGYAAEFDETPSWRDYPASS